MDLRIRPSNRMTRWIDAVDAVNEIIAIDLADEQGRTDEDILTQVEHENEINEINLK